MSSANNDQKNAPAPSSGLSIGLIVGGIVLAMILIGVVVFFIKRRQAAGANSGTVWSSDGGKRPWCYEPRGNAVAQTTLNVNAGRTTA
jgi:hypothetical protein